MRPTRAEINLDAIRGNLAALRAKVGAEVRILGVVKANAYGHGAVPVARCLVAEGIDWLGVAFPEEGAELRQAGIDAPILMLGGVAVGQLALAVENNLTPIVGDIATAEALERLGRASGRPLSVHLKIDTGMNRLGVRDDEAEEFARRSRTLKFVRIDGVCTHLSSAEEEDRSVSIGQLEKFRRTLQAIEEDIFTSRVDSYCVHIANSAAIMYLPESYSREWLLSLPSPRATRYARRVTMMVRPGLSLYGLYSAGRGAEKVSLQPAMAIKSQIVMRKTVRRGEGVSYGLTWRAPRDGVVGVLPIGYGDGYNRLLSNRGHVRVGEHHAPVIGNVCMDATMIDLTDVPDAAIGTEVTLLEARHDSPINAESIARLLGTISYEVVTGISARVPRVYI